LKRGDGRARVYRRRNERFANNDIQEVDRFGDGSAMMWAAISHTRKTALVHIPGVKTIALTGRLALIPASCRRERTVWSEILRCPGIAAAVDVAVVNLFRK
jgi:hypothetical protein